MLLRAPIAALVAVALALAPAGAWAQPAAGQPAGGAAAPGGAGAPTAPAAKKSRLGLLRLESLGLEAELVLRLELLFRAELERLEGQPLPKIRDVDRAVAGDAALRGCTGDPACLAAIGKKLGVEYMVFGTVGALGDSYVINLKLVEVAGAKEIRRVEEPLSGAPDELIEAVRVAAYRLWAPDRLRGSIDVLADVSGAEVFVDGKKVGKTPLAQPVAGMAVGKHSLRLAKPGYTDFIQDVDVRFQKSTQVVVRLVRAEVGPGGGPGPGPGGPLRDAPTPWYASSWGMVGIAAGAVLLGLFVGVALADDDIVDCDRNPGDCM